MITEVTRLFESNFRDTAKALRAIADQIEATEFGDQCSAHVVIVQATDELNVFGIGTKSSPSDSAFAFQRGIHFLVNYKTNRG
jgi:hypothetical protein